MAFTEKLLMEFLSYDPYSRLRSTLKIDLRTLIRALNWAAAQELIDAFYELGLDKTLKQPRSAIELAHEHYIVAVDFLQEILNSLVRIGILDEATGRYKIRFFQRKFKKPKIFDELKKTPLNAVFEIIHMMGDDIVDVLMTGERELDWIRDAAIAFEPLEFSPQITQFRLLAIDAVWRYIRQVLILERIPKPKILVIGLSSGFGLLNVAQYFRGKDVTIVALDPSEREAKLAKELLEEFSLSAHVEVYDISKRLNQSKLVRELLKQGEFDLVIIFERWRFYNNELRAQILTNIAYSMAPHASVADFDLTKEETLIFNTLLYTIKGWVGFPTTSEKRNLYGLIFQRIKERHSNFILRADLPLVKGVII